MDSPDKNTGVGCHSLPQGIFPTWGLNQTNKQTKKSTEHKRKQECNKKARGHMENKEPNGRSQIPPRKMVLMNLSAGQEKRHGRRE